jgi:IS5 family transposase
MEVYLRLMFLKFRYRLGYETLCREVSDSIMWRRFCRIPLDGQVPHATTLMKLTTRCRTAAVDGCNQALLAKAGRGRLRRVVDDLTGLLAATRRIAAQTRRRLSGTTPDGATRWVSLHDGDARPIAKGRLGRPVEFGYKAQVVDNDDGVVLDHVVDRGNPADAPQLAPAVGRVIARTGRRPRTVTADRGYGEARVEDDLHELGVRTVVIPRKARPAKPDKHTNTGERSAAPSSGAPAVKPGSAPSNGNTAGIAAASTTWTGPGSGPDTGSWSTTSSRSPRCQNDHLPKGDQLRPSAVANRQSLPTSGFFRSK